MKILMTLSIHIDYLKITNEIVNSMTINNEKIINVELEKQLMPEVLSIGNVISVNFYLLC